MTPCQPRGGGGGGRGRRQSLCRTDVASVPATTPLLGRGMSPTLSVRGLRSGHPLPKPRAPVKRKVRRAQKTAGREGMQVLAAARR